MPSQLSSGELLTSCDKEPIHIPGAIQPHGCLLAFRLSDLTLCCWSANARDWIGREPAEGLELSVAVPGLRGTIVEAVVNGPNGVVEAVKVPEPVNGVDCHAAIHRVDGVLIVEIERSIEPSASPLKSLPLRLNVANQRLQTAREYNDLFDIIASEVRDVSGFDRVMVYRFLPGGHGSVVGEAVRDDLESFRGLHYPATDIPQQARRLYRLNTVRSITDIEASPCPLQPGVNPVTGRPLDLSFSRHRAVSPVHVEYLHNMGVRASMSISVLCDGELWGLVACHHYEPRRLSFDQRAACEVLGVMAGAYLTTGEQAERNKRFAERRGEFFGAMRNIAASDSFFEGIASELSAIARAVEADGAAVYFRGGIRIVGDTPPVESIEAIGASLHQAGEGSIFACDELGESGHARGDIDLGPSCGLLWLPLDTDDVHGIIFFRSEYSEEVSWAGDPSCAKTESDIDGEIRLSPRQSFAAWKEVVCGKCREWSEIDLQVGEEILAGLTESLARRAAALSRLNAELSRINSDLDAFAYSASHDLREPLRGLSQTVYLLKEHLGDQIDAETAKRCDALDRLTERLDELIGGLLRLSRAGRGDLKLATFRLEEAVREAVEMLPSAQADNVEIEVEDCEIRADYLCVRELLTNLISNAIKYNDSDPKRLWIGSELAGTATTSVAAAPRTYYVRDNGIGVPEDQHLEVFEIFRRLHAKHEYGGGSGAGLAIVKKIAQRHGGDAWLTFPAKGTSPAEGGTTVWFNLGDEHG